jgi:hypothetical protein
MRLTGKPWKGARAKAAAFDRPSGQAQPRRHRPLATAVSVLGPLDGLKLVDSIPGTAAAMKELTADGEKAHESARWKDVRKTGPLAQKARQE